MMEYRCSKNGKRLDGDGFEDLDMNQVFFKNNRNGIHSGSEEKYSGVLMSPPVFVESKDALKLLDKYCNEANIFYKVSLGNKQSTDTYVGNIPKRFKDKINEIISKEEALSDLTSSKVSLLQVKELLNKRKFSLN